MSDLPRYAPAAERLKIGHITPSSNTVLEPMTCLLSRDLDERVSHHFARIPVQAITLRREHTAQFDAGPMLAAAELLADASVDAIVWNGTSAGWNGVEEDQAICALIAERTGIPCSTSTLAFLDLLARRGFSRCALAVPYTADVTARIVDVFRGQGVKVVGIASAGVSENRAMALVSEESVRALVQRADTPEAECVVIFCTGVAGAHIAPDLEVEVGKPVLDSVAVTLWKALDMVGLDASVTSWGGLLTGTAIASAPRR